MKNLREKNADFLRKKHEERKQDIIDLNRSCLSELNQRFNIIEVDQKTLFVPKAQADIYASDQFFNELLYTAFGTKDSQMVDAFLTHKETCEKVREDRNFHPQTIHLDFSYKNPSGTSIAMLCLWMNDDKLFEFAVEKGADIHALYGGNTMLLHNAVADRNVRITQILLERGAHINSQDSFGLTPLMTCATSYHPQIFDLLLAKDPAINVTSVYGENSLTIAARHNIGIDAIKKLLDKGAQVDAYNTHSHGPLSYAIANNHSELVELLIQHHADTRHHKVHAQCAKLEPNHPIRNCIINRNFEEQSWQEQVQHLMQNIELKHNSRRKAKNYFDDQADAVARIYDLIKDQDDLSSLQQAGLLHQVAQFGNDKKFILFLKDRAFDVNQFNQDGLTVLQSCVKNQNKTMLTSLLDEYVDAINQESLKAILLDLVRAGKKDKITLIKDHAVFVDKFTNMDRNEIKGFCDLLRKENKNDDLKQTIADLEETLFRFNPKKTKSKAKKEKRQIRETPAIEENVQQAMELTSNDNIAMSETMYNITTTTETQHCLEIVNDIVEETLDILMDWNEIKNIAQELGQKKTPTTSSPIAVLEQEDDVARPLMDNNDVPRPVVSTRNLIESDLKLAKPFKINSIAQSK